MSTNRAFYNKTQQAPGDGAFVPDQVTASGAQRCTNGDGDVITVTYTLDTSAYASGDLLADTQALSTTACDQNAGCVRIDSITIVDEDAQGVALYVLIHSASTSMGTENSAPNISDANARNILAIIPVATTDYVTVSGTKVATLRSLGTIVKTAAGSQALYTSLLNGTGTPTFTATGVTAQFGITQI